MHGLKTFVCIFFLIFKAFIFLRQNEYSLHSHTCISGHFVEISYFRNEEGISGYSWVSLGRRVHAGHRYIARAHADH